MIIPELKRKLLEAFDNGSSRVNVLEEFKEVGGGRKDALDTLRSMRELGDEAFEDRILDLMDVVNGTCLPHIWEGILYDDED